MIGFLGNKKIKHKKMKNDNNSRIIVLKVEIDDKIFFMILKILCELEQILEIFSLDSYKNDFFAGSFNCFLNSNFEASGGYPTLKKKSISKIMQLLEKYDLIDIWRIRNLFSKRYTFSKNHFQDTYKGVYIIYLFLTH